MLSYLAGGAVMSAEEKNKTTVEIYGTQYKLVGNSSLRYTKMVADHVNEHMQRVAKGHPRLDTQRIAVLAAVNMADEFFKVKAQMESLQNEHDQLKQQLAETSGRVKQQQQQDSGIYEEYKKLQEEYLKLQNEFNEWIQLSEKPD
jgi:cell division protein ZapA (FtsZ GTPase activity inhibitor)